MDFSVQNAQGVFGNLAMRGYDSDTSTGKPLIGTCEPSLAYFIDKGSIDGAVKYFYNSEIARLSNEIRSIINRDEYIDGEVSESEVFALEAYKNEQIDLLVEALMQMYTNNLSNVHILEGILTMISSVPYEAVYPKGQTIAIGLLFHKDLLIRDRAIQCFERWDSKKGLNVLKSLDCHPGWLQAYADKVIKYIERDGL